MQFWQGQMLDRRKDVTLLSLEAQSWLVRDQFPFRAEKEVKRGHPRRPLYRTETFIVLSSPLDLSCAWRTLVTVCFITVMMIKLPV